LDLFESELQFKLNFKSREEEVAAGWWEKKGKKKSIKNKDLATKDLFGG